MSLPGRLAVCGVFVFAVACGSTYSPAPSTAPSPSAAPTSVPAPAGSTSAVTIPIGASTLGSRAFAPDDVTVAAGTTVSWMNADVVSHTSTSNGGTWDSGVVAPGGQFSVAFPTAGTYQYHCAIHPGMVGTVIVQ